MTRLRDIEPWPIAVGGLLLSMAAVLIALAWIASTNPVQVVDEDPFRASEAYNEAFRRNAQDPR